MKAITLATALFASMSALAVAQESKGAELWEPSSFSRMLPTAAIVSEVLDVPRSLSAEPREEEAPMSFSIGPAGGFIKAPGADRGTWFAGAQARLHFLGFLAAEASVTFHENHYEHGDVVVVQYPVQFTAFLYILPVGPVRPYILGGVGWYYTSTEYSGAFASAKDTTQNVFGEHLGAGTDLMLGSRTSLNVDVRYIFQDPTNEKVVNLDYNYWQVTFGLNFSF